MRGVRSVARNASAILSVRMLTRLMRALYIVILARYLGPEMFGLFAYGQSWYIAFLPLTALGLGPVLSREIGRDRGSGAKLVNTSISLKTISALVGAILCAVLGWITDPDAAARNLLMLFALALAGRSIALWAEEVFIAYESSRLVLRQNMIFRPAEIAIAIAVLVAGGDLMALAITHGLIWWLQAAAGLSLLHRRLVALRPRWSPSEVGHLLRAGLPICVAGVLGSWLMHGPLILFRHTAGTGSDLGQLAMAIQILTLTIILPASVAQAALPVMSRAVQRGDGKETRYLEGMGRLGVSLAVGAGLTALTVIEPLFDLVLGSGYSVASELVTYVLWLLLPFSVAIASSQVLVARGHFTWTAPCALAGALVMTAATVPLASAHGAIGAVIALAAGLIVWALALLVLVAREGRVNFGLAFVRPCLSAALAIAAYWAVMGFDRWLALALAGVLFVALMTFAGTTRSERGALREILRNRFGAAHGSAD